MTVVLSVLTLASASLSIRAECRGPRYQVYIFKPLTTFLILLIAVHATGPAAPLYKYAIVAGLVCSLAGDVFLMLPGDRFAAGLACFLLVHLCYIAAFWSCASPSFTIWWAAPFLVHAIIMSRALLPHLGKMKWPVLMYELVIVTMAWRAAARWAALKETTALLAVVGAVLFLISDSALAINRFISKYRGAQALILGSYFCAQWLIAMSV